MTLFNKDKSEAIHFSNTTGYMELFKVSEGSMSNSNFHSDPGRLPVVKYTVKTPTLDRTIELE